MNRNRSRVLLPEDRCDSTRRRNYLRYGKRPFDLLGATLLAGVTLPVQLVVAVATRVGLDGPVLFRHSRPGLGGRPFTLYKFRTMTDTRDEHGVLLPDDQRLTPLGRCLRATSLDELPELYNVIKGDMSLVGPRPPLTRYLDRYSPQD